MKSALKIKGSIVRRTSQPGFKQGQEQNGSLRNAISLLRNPSVEIDFGAQMLSFPAHT